MSEGPLNFGKPLLWLTIIGCAGGGYYASTHWPYTYEGQGWSVRLPHDWTLGPSGDPTDQRLVGSGPLPKSPTGEEQTGVVWAKVVPHGTLDWNLFQQTFLPGTADWTQDDDIDYKKSRLFMYEDQTTRYYGAMVDRTDVMIMVGMGTNKTNFPMQKEIFEKAMKTIRCQR